MVVMKLLMTVMLGLMILAMIFVLLCFLEAWLLCLN